MHGTQSNHWHTHDQSDSGEALLVEEVALAISCNGVSYAVMMVTPVELEAFVIGFLHSEGIINHPSQLLELEIGPAEKSDAQWLAEVQLNSRQLHQLKQRNRQLRGATGCGICGLTALEQATPPLPPLPRSTFNWADKLSALRTLLNDHQPIGAQAGAIHAALLLDAAGDPLFSCEDIGRHNALDKLIGRALQQRLDLSQCAALMSSRCSTELIQKAARAGLPTLIHLASPSTLAVAQARSAGLRLIHLPRHAEPRFYSPMA